MSIYLGIEMILGLLVIMLVLVQPSKSDALSGLVSGVKNESFYKKNKDKTKESMLEKSTYMAMALFCIWTIFINLI